MAKQPEFVQKAHAFLKNLDKGTDQELKDALVEIMTHCAEDDAMIMTTDGVMFTACGMLLLPAFFTSKREPEQSEPPPEPEQQTP